MQLAPLHPGMSYENAIYNIMTQVREVEERLSMIPEVGLCTLNQVDPYPITYSLSKP
jgi:hypothetical protein